MYYLLDLEHIGPLVSEEKVIFGLNARAVSQLTLAKIRKIYSRVDSKSIAKQVNILNFLFWDCNCSSVRNPVFVINVKN